MLRDLTREAKMKALIVKQDHKVGLEDVQMPRLSRDHEAIVRVTTAAICGSDLHAKHGLIPGLQPGTVIGHEFVGIVEEVGSFVDRFKPGDRVTAPPAFWCGTCPACKKGNISYCHNGGWYGGGDLFGKGYQGAQAAYVKVPYADNCLVNVPNGIDDNEAVLVGDVFQTGYHAAYEGHIQAGDTVVLFGCGPIGLGALISAKLFGPKQVFAVDMRDQRLAIAKHFGGTPIDARVEDVLERTKEATDGEGADVAIEAVGLPETFLKALRVVRRIGTVSVVGVFGAPVEFPIQELLYQGVRISIGLGYVGRTKALLNLVEYKQIDLSPLVTHTFSLDDAVEAYDLFENHQDRCMKVLLKP
jgi:threonine dehydrogenase-like Zn-dependent dehydrogenase